jgi:LysR family glycine cleavage system transcriptional activator
MRRTLPPLTSLRAFEAVARNASISDAAKELHVTRAAVSQQVKVLETYLGRRLLRRQGGQHVLTQDALAGLADLREAFDRLGVAVEKLRTGQRKVLTISVEPALASTWLVPRLQSLRERYPNLDVLLDATTEIADFDRSRVDIALRYGHGNYAGLHSEHLFGDELFPVCSPKLARGKPTLKKLEDLKHHALLHVDWASPKGDWPGWTAWLKAAGVTDVDSQRGMRFSSHAMAIRAAIDGQGVVLGSTALVRDDLAGGRLVRPFKLSVPTSFAYFVVCQANRADEPDIAAFRAWMLQQSQHGESGPSTAPYRAPPAGSTASAPKPRRSMRSSPVSIKMI